jgi:hypothetical protein
MNHLQLFINDQPVDLDDDSPIALTFQINNLAEVKNQQGNTSNQFKLPLTQRNRQILGFPDDVAFTNNLPYENYKAKVVQDGLEIIPYGIAVLNGVEQESAAITILSGNVDFFDALDVKIYDMGDDNTTIGKQKAFNKFNHTWDVDTVALSQQKTEGWIWPVVDYGKIATDFTNNPEIDVRFMRPGFFLKTAIELFVRSAGYRIHPDSFLQKQPLYNKLIVQFANDNFEHGINEQMQAGANGVNALLGSRLEVPHLTVSQNTQGTVRFANVQTNNGSYNSGTGRYTATAITKLTITLKIPSLYFYGKLSKDYGSSVDIGIMYTDPIAANGEVILVQQGFDLSDDIKFEPHANLFKGFAYRDYNDAIVLSYETDIPIGGQLRVFYTFKGYTGSRFAIPANSELTIKTDNEQVLYGQSIQCERILPDLTQKDLLKDTLQRFGIICQTDNTTRMVNFASFKDIVGNIPIAKNWSKKCLDQGKAISFQLGGYAQVNYMKYKEDEAILPKGLGNGQINVADKTLPANAEMFESQFAPTLNRPYLGGSIAQIRKVDTTDDPEAVDFTISTQPRLLVDKKLNLLNLGKQVTFTDGNSAKNKTINDVISVPYFYREGEPDSLLWEDLRKKYYPELEKILKQTKKVERYFMLSPRDILELDLLIPVYLEQDSAYYYINKIDSWRKGQPVKVELVKLG